MQPMTLRTLIRRSLRFHWRSHLGVWLGALVGSAALIGALVVGESVRGSLRERALARIGTVQFALSSGDRLFGTDLAAPLGERIPVNPMAGRKGYWFQPRQVTPTLHLKGTAAKQDGSARANELQIYGGGGFWSLSLAAEEEREASLVSERALHEASQAMEEAMRAANRRMITNLPGVPPAVVLPPSDSNFVQAAFENLRRAQSSKIAAKPWSEPEAGKVKINTALADQLQARLGDTIILRFHKSSALSQDAVLSPRDQSTVALRAVVDGIVDSASLGDISLMVGHRPPLNAFVNLEELRSLAGARTRANLMLVGQSLEVRAPMLPGWRASVEAWVRTNGSWLPERLRRAIAPTYRISQMSEADAAFTFRHFNSQLRKHWRLGDAELMVRTIEQPDSATGDEHVAPTIEVATPRIFLDPLVGEAALNPRTALLTNHVSVPNDKQADIAKASFVTNGVPLITYLVNAMRFGDKLTPYSMVTAVGAPWTPAGMADDEIVINEWLANDLGLKSGDHVELVYFDPESGSRLLEHTNAFKVRSIVPMRGLHADRTLMPEFPGVANAESTGDWDTGFPLAHKIRDQDETYWKQHRGTPKAFITLNAGRKMWANRFGEFTAVRYFVPTNGFPPVFRDIVEANLIGNLDPSQLGLVFQPVREQALKAANESQDFGGLFIGFSFFLILAALLLMAMLFSFGVEQRAAEIGTYLAVGFPLKQVRRMFLREGIAIATLGALAGTVAGVLYAKGMLWGLATIWSKAVGGSALGLHYSLGTLVGGAVASVAVAAVAIWLTMRKQGRQPVRELLAGGGEEHLEGRARHSVRASVQIASSERRARSDAPYQGARGQSSRGWWVGSISGGLALGLVGFALAQGEAATAGAFFGAGALLLVAGLGFTAALLAKLARSADPRRLTLSSLGIRGCSRRRNRSLAVAAMLASGSFLILSIGAFRLDADRDATKRSSGTGGFAFIGETTLPVTYDLNTRAGRENYGLNERDLEGVSFVPFRVREGDEASCLNLNRAQQPRLLGVKSEMLAERGAFTFAKGEGWPSLRSSRREEALSGIADSQSPIADTEPTATNEIPAIGDANSIQWAMGKKIGDTIDYVDERGQPFKVKIVGAVANSVLQGQLIIDEAEFIRRFPSAAGHRYFLVDSPALAATNVSTVLSRALSDVGLEVTPAATRLAQFNAVQNTYLNTFQILGGLGLLLGSAGLGVVVLRNVLERRGELALLLAIGFTRRLLARVVLVEHVALLAAGLVIGVVAAGIAVLPALISPGAEPPSWSLGILLMGVLANGFVWTMLATRWALRGRLLDALRNE